MPTAEDCSLQEQRRTPEVPKFHCHRAIYSALSKQPYPRILLVDDDELYTSIFAEYALSLNFEIRVVNDYNDITFLDHERPDIAIVDYDLGSASGPEISLMLYSLFGPTPTLLISAVNRRLSDEGPYSVIYDFIPKSLGAHAILDGALDAYEWWKLNN